MIVIRGTINPQPPPPDLAAVGDSITANLGMTSFHWGNALRGAPFNFVLNAGVHSETIGGALARINNSYTASPPGLAGLRLGCVQLREGTNNVAAGNSLASQMSNMDALVSAMLSYAPFLILLSIPPYGDGSAASLVNDYNGYWSSIAAANPARIVYVDDSYPLDAGGGAIRSDCSDDFVHPNQRGTFLQGQAWAADAGLTSFIVNTRLPTATLLSSGADVYPAQPQWISNPLMSGTGGTLGTGFTGQLADGWTIARSAGLVTGVCSKVVDGRGEWQRIVPTGAGGSGADLTIPLTGRAITATDPAYCEILLELRFNSLDTFAAYDFTADVFDSDGTQLCPPSSLLCFNIGSALTKSSVVLRSSIPRDNAASHTGATFRLHFRSEGNSLGSPGSVDVRVPSVRG